MADMQELNMEEMEEVNGGKGGYAKKPDTKYGFELYQIQRGDTLIRIANNKGCTVDEIKNANRSVIKSINDITAGYWIYIPKFH